MPEKKHFATRERPKNAFAESEKKILHSFPIFNPNPVIEVSALGKITFSNKAALDVSRNLGSKTAAVLLPKDLKNILKQFRLNQKKKGFYREIYVKERVFGEHIHFVPSLKVARIYITDITKRIKAEQEMEKLNIELEKKVEQRTKEIARSNRAMAMLSFCNKALIYSSTQKKLLKEICRIIVEVGGYRWAWIGSAEKDKEKSVKPLAQMGSESDYLKSARISWSRNNPRGRGPVGLAIRTGKIFVGKNFSENSNLAPWKTEALKRGFGSVIALPLKKNREVSGVLVIYSRDDDAFSKKEIELLFELTEDLAFGINTLEVKAAHQEAEAAVRSNNELLSLSNKATSKQNYLDRLVRYLKKWSGCNYVGIRILKKKEFIPYESYVGYSREFWESESMLSLKKDQCACVRVIAEKPEPQDASVMTESGSFYTNNSREFISGLTKEEASRFRGKCIRCGFASITIVPIRRRGSVLGAIHLADKKANKFPEKKVKSLEMMAAMAGEAINKFNTQERLRENEERYRELVENANSIIMRLNKEGNITFFNEFAQNFFGFKEKEVIGKNVVGTIVPETDAAGQNLREMVKNIFKNPKRYETNENENMLKNGTRVWISWNNKPEYERNGKFKGFLCIGTDITDRKKREEQLVESYKHLGIINRKIPLLLELNNYPKGLKKKEVAERVLSSAVNISKANLGLLYRYGKDKKFHLISSAGPEKVQIENIKTLKVKECRYLKSLLKEIDSTQKISSGEENLCFEIGKRMDHSLLLPIGRKMDNKLKGFIFLGFKSKTGADIHEMSFYDVFSMHASSALLSAEILK